MISNVPFPWACPTLSYNNVVSAGKDLTILLQKSSHISEHHLGLLSKCNLFVLCVSDVIPEVEVESLKGKLHPTDLKQPQVFSGFRKCTVPQDPTELSCLFLSGLHHSVIPAAVLVAVLIFALLAGATWFGYKRGILCFRGLPTFASAYYRQTSTQSSESDGNVLITDLSAFSGQ